MHGDNRHGQTRPFLMYQADSSAFIQANYKEISRIIDYVCEKTEMTEHRNEIGQYFFMRLLSRKELRFPKEELSSNVFAMVYFCIDSCLKPERVRRAHEVPEAMDRPGPDDNFDEADVSCDSYFFDKVIERSRLNPLERDTYRLLRSGYSATEVSKITETSPQYIYGIQLKLRRLYERCNEAGLRQLSQLQYGYQH